MRKNLRRIALAIVVFLGLALAGAWGQSNSGSIEGTVKDQSGAVIPNATVEITNPVSGFHREVKTGADGAFRFTNLPFNPYHMVAKATGFADFTEDVDVRSTVSSSAPVTLQVSGGTQSVTVQANGGDLIETEPTFHTDVDQELIEKLPLESASSSVSSLVTLTTPGVAADSNGLFHGLGDHAENSFSVDGQPISDQQSKVFSNQIPSDSIQSLEVISGAPPADFGDKTSLVIKVTTKSGMGVTTPTGSVYTSYGSFGTANVGFDLAYGGQNWGNFISANGLRTGRFLDPPEFTVMHDAGNQQNIFDRVDFNTTKDDTIHFNFNFTRSWFQNPNSYDQQTHFVSGVQLTNPLTGAPLGPTDQRSQIRTFDVAPSWTRVVGTTTVFTFGGWVRKDLYNYYPSGNAFNDWSPDLQSETFGQARTLTNAGARAEMSYVKGIHNVKAGIVYQQTLLNENDSIGIVDPTLNAPGSANFNPVLAPYDLTHGGRMFTFAGHTDVKEFSTYLEDDITKGNWAFNLGMRGDVYNGLTSATQAEPRVGLAYKIKPSSSVLQLSYARTLETPFNENLILASEGCGIPFLAALVPPPGVPCSLGSIKPGWRNEFHAGLQQAFGKYLVVDGEYIWKYTHNAYDFGVVGNTPLAFPIEWQSSKVTGFAIRASVPDYHGFTALVTMSSVSARFFLPQEAGLPIVPLATGVFRIDHDEAFNETTHLQYQPWKTGPWVGFNWRYDSGFVTGAVPCLAATATCAASTSIANGGANPNIGAGQIALVNNITGAPLTADQEFEAGLLCNGVPAAPTPFGPALATCAASQLTSKFVKIPAPGTENDDHNPQRIQPRNLFDVALGEDNLFHGDRYRWSLEFTVVNLMNTEALYNFLSTFSGTHYVTPRTETMELAFHF